MDQSNSWWLTRRGIIALWLLAGLLLVGTLGAFPVTRTQEARVLVSAREMTQSSNWRDWMVPRLNGELRLQKPPLAYWATAGSYQLFGVHEWSGRLPMALAGWLMLGLTYRLGRNAFNARTGLFAGGVMGACYLFARNARLAETDILAALFATAAVAAIWKCFDLLEPFGSRPRNTFFWFHATGACLGLTVLAKGPPALFPLLFLLVFAAVTRRWRVALRFLASGALLTTAVIALPWFLYISNVADTTTIDIEVDKIRRGLGHYAPPWQHLIYLFKGSLPWIGFTILGILVAIARCRTDRRVVPLLIWIGVVLIPLSLVGQKQEHYLVPILPPVMILTGWVIDEALRREDPRLTRWSATILKYTLIGGLVAAMLPLVGAFMERGDLALADVVIGTVVALMMSWAAWTFRRHGLDRAFGAALAAWLVSMSALVGVWGPSINRPNWKDVARLIRERGEQRPYVFYAIPSIPLLFYLESPIPVAETLEELYAMLRENPGVNVIFEDEPRQPVAPPIGLTERVSLIFDENRVSLYRAEAGQTFTNPASPATTAPSAQPPGQPPASPPP